MTQNFKGLLCALLLLFFDLANGNAVKFGVSCDDEVLMDYAMITSLSLPPNQAIYGVNSQCYKCTPSLITNITTDCSMIWTPHEWTIYLTDVVTGNHITNIIYSFGDQGKYEITVSNGNNGKYSLHVSETKAPVDSLQPFWIAFGLLLVVVVASFGGPYLYNRFKSKSDPQDLRDSIKSSQAFYPLLADDSAEVAKNDSKVLPTEEVTRISISSRSSHQENRVDEEGGRRSLTPNSSKHSLHSLAELPVASQVPSAAASSPAVKTKPPRLNSLDTFRGFSLCIMIFVNYGGGGYWFFDHAPWHGLTFADLLFPWFMWMMGVSMALSFSAMGLIIAEPVLSNANSGMMANRPLEYHAAPWSAWAKVLQRSATLFGIGMFLANGYDYKTWRIPGVLQYFAVSYLITSATVLYYLPTTNEKIRGIRTWERLNGANSNKWALHPEDRGFFGKYCGVSLFPNRILLAYAGEWPFQLLLIIIYLAVSLGAAAPGCPTGYQGPGGLGNDSAHWDCTGGIHRYIDMKVSLWLRSHLSLTNLLTTVFLHVSWINIPSHHYLEPTPYRPYDPEGLLGVLTACTLTYLGLMTGRVILHYKGHKERLQRWAAWSMIQLFLAGCLCGFSQFEGPIPINKNLWTTSFCFVTSGFGLIGLSICYILVDIYKVWSGAPFIYLGMNSILMYTGSELLWKHFPFSYEIYGNPTHAELLPMNMFGVFSWIVIAFYCYKIKFFVKV